MPLSKSHNWPFVREVESDCLFQKEETGNMGCLASVQHVQVHPKKPTVFTVEGNYKGSRTLSDFSVSSQNHTKNVTKIPLTEQEIFAITKSWRTISSNMTDTGIAMFIKMFEGHSDVKSMFEQFRSVDKHDLYDNRSLENHALLVMNALDESIGNLDDQAYLIEMLLTTGMSHRRFENFNHDIFWAIEEPFLSAVKNALGDRLSPKLEATYRKAIKFILSTLIEGFKEDLDEENSQR